FHFGWSELLAATDDRLRYIKAPRPELYDVRDDPGEKKDLAGARAQAAAGLAGWLQAQAGTGGAPVPSDVPPDVKERLQALGYVSSVAAPPSAGPLADPKDKVKVYEAYRAATALRAEHKDAEAILALQKALADAPEMLDAREVLGETLFRLGRA